MNKKIIYSLVLTSIFVMSIASVCIQPVAGDTNWKFGVPKEAKGLKLKSEVKVYDKSVWGDCLGICRDVSVNEKYGGDGTAANDVGATSQSEISDWERDDIWWFGDYLMKSDVPPNCDGSKVSFGGVTLSDYWSAVTAVEEMLRTLGTLNGTRASPSYGNPLQQFETAQIAILENVILAAISVKGTHLEYLAPGTDNATLLYFAQQCTDKFYQSTYTRAEVSALYHKTYRGTVVERDTWDFALDLESDPDERDAKAPFIENPEDLYDSFKYFNGFLNDEFRLINNMINALILVNTTYQSFGPDSFLAPPYDDTFWSWYYINATLGLLFDKLLLTKAENDIPTFQALRLQMLAAGVYKNCMDTLVDTILLYSGHGMLQEGPGLMMIVPFFTDETPQQGREYIDMLIDGGIPAHQPVDKWLSDLFDEFDIDDEVWVGDNVLLYDKITINYISKTGAPATVTGVPVTDDLFRGKAEVDGLVVTLEWEWPEGFLNNKGFPEPAEERDDYEIVYTYGDTGGQSKTEYYSGDTLFYEIEGIAPTIVGYEVSILLGAAAIATLGLIFVVIKKRRM